MSSDDIDPALKCDREGCPGHTREAYAHFRFFEAVRAASNARDTEARKRMQELRHAGKFGYDGHPPGSPVQR